MCHLLRLPPEILVYIFELLDDLDDALHLARCCRRIYRTFNPSNTRLRIFRSIIRNADHHALEPDLFLLVGLNERFALYDESPVPRGLSYRKEFFQQHLAVRNLSAAAIWEVVCRWHAMRLLFDFYCDTSIQTSYSLARWQASEERWKGEDPLPPPVGCACDVFQELNARERQRSYQRFYKALTAHWAMVEMLWVARVAAYHSPDLRDEAHARIWDMFTNTTRSLQEKIDIVEVVDFVWGFLARKNFHLPSFSIWLQGQSEEVVQDYRGRDETDDWQYFVQCILEFLRPPHILELLILSTWSSNHTWKVDRPTYLRRLGFFDTRDGIVEHDDQVCFEEAVFPVSIWGKDVENELRRLVQTEETVASESQSDLVSKWEWYRNVTWAQKERGQLLFRNEDPQAILNRIRDTYPD